MQKRGDTGHLHILLLQQSCALGENMIPNMNHFTPQQEIGTQSTIFFFFFFWNHPHTRKLLWIKACTGFLIGTQAKEKCSVTVNRQISWLKRLNKVVFWPWISSPRMQGALLVSQWEALAGKRKRSVGLGCFAIYIFNKNYQSYRFWPRLRTEAGHFSCWITASRCSSPSIWAEWPRKPPHHPLFKTFFFFFSSSHFKH